MAEKKDYLKEVVEHIDIKKHNVVPLVEAMENMAFSARDLNRAAQIYDRMIKDENCAIILNSCRKFIQCWFEENCLRYDYE